MAWVDRAAIDQGTRSMLQVNMGVRQGERVLVLADMPTPDQWAHTAADHVEAMLRRAYMARLVADIAREHLPGASVRFLTFPSTGRSGVEPAEGAARAMQEADVALAITSYSLSHTEAREEACRRGARVASMPRFLPEMLYPEGPMAVDYESVASSTRALAGLITAASKVRLTTPAGTEIEFSVVGRDGRSDDGIYTAKGSWGNLPAGEAYCAPLEGTGHGLLVVEPGWHAGLGEPMKIRMERGEVTALEGGGVVGSEISAILDLQRRGENTRPRRMLAELGIGTNPNARRTDITVEAEKIKGTVHLAVGDSSHLGGVVVADYHQDFVIPRPDLWFDGEIVIAGGRWVAPAIAGA